MYFLFFPLPLFLCQMEWKRQAFCSMDKSQIVARGATSCCHDFSEIYHFKGIFATLIWCLKKKTQKLFKRLLFIKKFWTLIQLEMAILHFLTKTGGHRINIVSEFDGYFLLNVWGICDLVVNVMFRNCMVSFRKSQVRINEDKEVRLKRGKIWSFKCSFIKTSKRELWKNLKRE